MKRTQIYLEDQQKIELEKIAEHKNTSMAELIREAINRYIVDYKEQVLIDNIKSTFGLWKDRNDIKDSVNFVETLRREWDRRLN